MGASTEEELMLPLQFEHEAPIPTPPAEVLWERWGCSGSINCGGVGAATAFILSLNMTGDMGNSPVIIHSEPNYDR